MSGAGGVGSGLCWRGRLNWFVNGVQVLFSACTVCEIFGG